MPSTKKNTRKLKKNLKKNKKRESLKKGGFWPFDKDDNTSFSVLDFFKSKTPEQKIEDIKKKKDKCIETADKELQEIQHKETVDKPVSESVLPPSPSIPPSAVPPSSISPSSISPSSISPSELPKEDFFQRKGGRKCKRTYRKK